MSKLQQFFPFVIFSPARLNMIKSINLSYFNRYSCVCRRLEGNSSLSSSESIQCGGPRKIWRVLFRQNMACFNSKLIVQSAQGFPKTSDRNENHEWRTVVNCGKQTRWRNNEEKQTVLIFFVGSFNFHVTLPFSCKRGLLINVWAGLRFICLNSF